jgi:hypothetical protein
MYNLNTSAQYISQACVMKAFFSLIALACLLGAAAARDVPANLRAFHDRIKHGQCTGGRVLQNGFYSEIGDSRCM